jgi:hypothetical protein
MRKKCFDILNKKLNIDKKSKLYEKKGLTQTIRRIGIFAEKEFAVLNCFFLPVLRLTL